MSDHKDKEQQQGSRLALQDLLPRTGVQGAGARPQVIFGIVADHRAGNRDTVSDKHTERG